MVIRSAAEADVIQGWISPEAQSAVEQTDFQRQLVIAVFQGWKPVYDYEVQVEQVGIRDHTVVVSASFLGPPTIEQHPVEASPYQVIRVSNENLNSETKFLLKANGQILTRTPPPPTSTTPPTPWPTQVASPYPTGIVELPFETVERADLPGTGGEYPGETPSLAVITWQQEAAGLGDTISPAAQDALRTLNYDREFAIVVFLGIKGTNMYGVEIQNVTREANRITVFAHFTQRDPQMAAADVVTSPYHIVKLSKAGLQGEFEFILNSDGADILSVPARL